MCSMKRLFSVLFMATWMSLNVHSPTSAQILWQKDASNPSIPFWSEDNNDPSGYKYALGPTVLYDSTKGVFRMWFESLAYGPAVFCISEAVSFDGTGWYENVRNPRIGPGPIGDFDDSGLKRPCIVKDDKGYKIYYYGWNGTRYEIGMASSPDGVKWTKSPANPVLRVGAPGTWEESSVDQPSVIFENGMYKMWYQGVKGVRSGIGYATSADGVVWQRSLPYPVIALGESGSWDSYSLGEPAVVKVGDKYYMTYTATSTGLSGKIGYAFSSDGIVWSKYNNNPVILPGEYGSWDDASVASGSLLLKGGRFQTWYMGKNNARNAWQIGYATSELVPMSVRPVNFGPTSFRLENNSPNPFNPETVIRYDLPKDQRVSLRIYNAVGQEVVTLVDGQEHAGSHSVVWRPGNIASGVYWYRLQTDEFLDSKKMTLLK